MTKKLKALSGILNKLLKHAESKQLDWHPKGMQEDALLQSRLISDQFPFVRQVQVACDNAKGAAARLAEVEMPKFEDNEKTVEERHTQICFRRLRLDRFDGIGNESFAAEVSRMRPNREDIGNRRADHRRKSEMQAPTGPVQMP